jgi:hypothetical protein
MNPKNVNTQDAATGAVKSSPLLEDDPFDDPAYQQFVEEMAEECSCEYDAPCDSLLAGGPCECRLIDHDSYDDDSHEIDDKGDLWFL